MDGHGTQQIVALGISTEAWAIVLATAIGPLLAVLITRWRDGIRETRGRRMAIFRTLMATRRTAINPEHVGALNLVEVEFYGVPPVEVAWSAYRTHINSAPIGRPMNEDESKAFHSKRIDSLATLLFSISKTLGYQISELDIRNGGYAPDGWRYRDERLGLIQEFALGMSLGRASLPVHAVQSPSPIIPSEK